MGGDFMNKNQQIIGSLVAVLIVGGVAFWGGMHYQQAQASASTGDRQLQAGGRMGGGMRRFGGMGGAVMGQIISQDDKSITVKLPDGSSKIVLLPASATISKTSTGAKSDLTTGSNVAVFGATNSDGSVTAQNVQLNPMFRMGRPDSSPSSPPKM